MLPRFFLTFAITSALLFTGCGGKEEVKKNEGVIVNTMPGAAGGPGGNSPVGGAPGANAPPPMIPTATAPPVPDPRK